MSFKEKEKENKNKYDIKNELLMFNNVFKSAFDIAYILSLYILDYLLKF